MSDSVTKWHEIQEELTLENKENQKILNKNKFIYVFVLDFEDGKVYRYSKWNPDLENVENFITTVGHNINECKWMVTGYKDIESDLGFNV